MLGKQLQRFTIYTVLVAQCAGAAGCRGEGSAAGPGNGGGSRANASTADRSTSCGEVAFRVLRRNLELSDPTDNPTGKVAALDARKQEFVTAIDTVLPLNVQASLPSALEDVLKLIDDGTIPGIASSVASILELLANDPQDPQREALNGLVKLSSSRAAIDEEQAFRLASRLFAYPEVDGVLKAIGGVVSENDGVDARGVRNAERDLVTELLDVTSERLAGLSRPAAGPAPAPSRLVTALLEEVELRGGVQVGAPAWAVRVDVNGNPKVKVDATTGRLFAPFIDQNRDNVADVDPAGDPIDAQGRKIEIPAFGDTGLRDTDRRALASGSTTLYEYFDAKKTALGQVLSLAGRLIEREVPLDLIRAIDATAGRVQQTTAAAGTITTYSADNPALDIAWGLLEIFRYRDAPKLLDTFATLIRNDPRRAERILVHLAKVVDILDRQTFQSSGNSNLLNELVPLLDKVFESAGAGQAAADTLAKNILDTFRTEVARSRQIPVGLARMMKYSDYPTITPTAPGVKSCLEQLMDMMAEANQCDSWPFGNMAEFYLDVMAGNKSILGISLSVYTANQLLDIPILRQLLCSKISPQNIRALHAFAQSGALDSLIPIARAFSLRGQTALLKNIFLAIGANYATALRPNEAVLVQVLESGVVEQIVDALNVLGSMTVPSTGEPVNGVTAAFIAALVDDDRVITDRRGVRHLTLLHLVLDPLKAMGDRIEAAGVKPQLDRAMRNAISLALATTLHDNGTPQNTADDYEALLNHGLIKLTAATLETFSRAMSIDPATRNRDITQYQADVVSLLTGREAPLVVDVILAVERSPNRRKLVDATVNLFVPNLNARNDIYGSILEIAAALLQAKSDPQAMVDVLRFAGRALDPARGWSKPLVTGLVKLMGGAQSSTIVTIIKNALDRGPAGTGKSPAETLASIFEEVFSKSLKPAVTLSAQSIADQAKRIAEFIRDKDKGLEAIFAQLRGRRR